MSMQRTSDRDRSLLGGLAAGLALAAIAAAVMIHFDSAREPVLQLLRWLERLGPWAAVLFVLMMAVVVVLVLPGLPFTTGAGFVFGVVQGSAYVVAGTTLGAVLAFLIARGLLGDRAARYLLGHPRLHLLAAEIAPHGWRLVLCTRLVPFFPFKLSNYFFGLTSVSLPAFALGTVLGIIPFTIHNVYLGAVAAELTAAGARSEGAGTSQLALYGAGLLMALVSVVYLGQWAWRTLGMPQVGRR